MHRKTNTNSNFNLAKISAVQRSVVEWNYIHSSVVG